MAQNPLECTCLNLRAAARRVSRRYDETMAPSGLLGSQFSMLCVVAAKPGCGVAEIAEILDMDVSTVTRYLRPLLAAGHVTVRPGADDAGRREVRLTSQGTRTLRKAHGLWEKAQRDSIAVLGERRSGELLNLLAAVR